jgi:hypothetical protein
MNEAYDVVSNYDIAHWGQEFLSEVADSAEKNGKRLSTLTSVA